MRSSRKLALVASDDEDESPPLPSKRNEERRKRKKIKFNDEDYVDEFEEEDEEDNKKDKKKGKTKDESDYDDDHEDSVQEDAKPIGDVIRVSGKGRGKRNHYEAFDYDGMRYDLEDPVLLVPEESGQKPYVAIIKDITQTNKGNMMVTGQWFYRPEEAEKKGGGNWQSRDARELFYSFHRDEVPAESVMHKCVVHFIPVNKQIPERKVHPGFIVQKVYDTDLRRLFKLTDKDYEDNKQHEIDLLVQKTFDRLGDVPDIETEDGSAADQEDVMRNKRLLRRKHMNMLPLDVSKEDEETRSGQTQRVETPGSCAGSASEYNVILAKYKALTGENLRDRWLEKLLQGIQDTCSHVDDGHKDMKEKNGPDEINGGSSKTTNDSKEQRQNGKKSFIWPDDAVIAVAALEKASHESFPSEFNKYNQKMRQLHYNLQKNAALARRLLNRELEPSKILNMSPNELKEGLTTEEITSKEPEESAHIQKTAARCERCNEKKVVVIDIIQAGHGARYQLECKGCGNRWYASRDEASILTIDEPSSRIVGTAPLATAKFEDVEKLASPRGETEKIVAADVLKKTTQAYVPVLDKQKSLNKQPLLPKADENVQQSITNTGE